MQTVKATENTRMVLPLDRVFIPMPSFIDDTYWFCDAFCLSNH
jgi:hypothetical protein